MSFKSEVYRRKRGVVRWLTKEITNNSYKTDDPKSKYNKILISGPNPRLENLLLLTSLIQEVVRVFPDCKIDLWVQGTLSHDIFKNYKNINRIFVQPQKPFNHLFDYFKSWLQLRRNGCYDLVINVVRESLSGQLSTFFCKSHHKIFGDLSQKVKAERSDYLEADKRTVYAFWEFLERSGIQMIWREPASVNLRLDLNEIKNGRQLLNLIADQNKITICLFTYASGAESYRKKWWIELYEQLKSNYPQVNFIEILPVEKTSVFDFKIPSFYSLDIREVASVMANSDLFVGANGGMAYLASACGVSVVKLFSVMDSELYQRYRMENSFVIAKGRFSECLIRIQEILSQKFPAIFVQK